MMEAKIIAALIINKFSFTMSKEDYDKTKIVSEILQFYNLVKPNEHESKEIFNSDIQLYLSPAEENTPDVFIMNPAMAYALYRQSTKVG